MHDRGVIFDVDGVLVDSYVPHLESWRRLAAEIGADITASRFAATFGRTSRDIIAILFDVTDSDAVRKLDARKESLYRDIIRAAVPAMPGAVSLVKSLHAAGFRLAVGSSGPPENVARVCEAMGLDAYLSASITGADVTRGKPDPQVFLLAAERLGLPAARCVVIEDAPAGIEAAHAAGMPCIALSSTHEQSGLSAAERVIDALADLRAADIDALLE